MCAIGVLCVRSGVAFVEISRGGWEMRAGLGWRSHLERTRRLNLDLDVKRRRQGDDEW
jgi:hypothetical protein